MNLKNSTFLRKYGKINIQENMFEFPFGAKHQVSKAVPGVELQASVLQKLSSYPDPGKQIVGIFLTPLSEQRRLQIEKIQMSARLSKTAHKKSSLGGEYGSNTSAKKPGSARKKVLNYSEIEITKFNDDHAPIEMRNPFP